MLHLLACIESVMMFIELGMLYLRDTLWYDEVTCSKYIWAWLPYIHLSLNTCGYSNTWL